MTQYISDSENYSKAQPGTKVGIKRSDGTEDIKIGDCFFSEASEMVESEDAVISKIATSYERMIAT